MRIGLKNRNILKAIIATLFVAIMVSGVLVVSVKASYYWISNPVFGEIIDEQGGAWDTVLGYRGLDLLSGNWRANLRIGSNQAWIDGNYFPATSVVVTPSSIISTLVNTASNPYGLSAGVITIDMNATMVFGTTYLRLRGYRYVESDPWVMEQSYTVKNTGSATLNNTSFYIYYFPSPYGSYPVNPSTWVSHVDYVAGIRDPMGFTFDISLYGEGSVNWAYTGLSASVAPTAHDVGHGGGYPDPPYYYPSPWRPSANPTDVLRSVENDNMRNWASYDAPNGTDPNAVAGALKWYIGSLAPGASWTITVLQSVAPPDAPKIAWIPVYVDIKPGSWPNPINVGSQGVFAVAICGTKDFDVKTINPSTVKIYIEGGKEGVSPLRWNYEDVATPYKGPPGGGHALGGDGYLDLVFQFDTQAVVSLDLATHVGETIPLIIQGNLLCLTPTPGQWDIFWSMGDVNRDGYINTKDIGIIAKNFGWSGPPGGNPADINSDGKVNMKDLSTCLKNRGLNIWTYFLGAPIQGQDYVWILTVTP